MFDDRVATVLEDRWGLSLSQRAERLAGGQESAVVRLGERVVRVGPPLAHGGRPAMVRARGVGRGDQGGRGDRAGADGRWRDGGARGRAAGHRLAVHPRRPRRRPGRSAASAGRRAARARPRCPRSHAVRATAVHGDFYAANVLVDRGAIVALLDWDEATVAPPEWELAGAAWEWGDGLGTLDLTAAERFVEHYLDAGGTATALTEVALRRLVRARIRSEVAYDRATTTGDADPDDAAYQRRQLEAFTALRPAAAW